MLEAQSRKHEGGKNIRHEYESETFFVKFRSKGIEVRRVARSTFIAITNLERFAGVPQFNSLISPSVEHHLESSLGTDLFLKYFILIEEEQNSVHIIPVKWIRKVRYVQAHPAKASGYIRLDIRYQPYGTNDARTIGLLRENGFSRTYINRSLNLLARSSRCHWTSGTVQMIKWQKRILSQ